MAHDDSKSKSLYVMLIANEKMPAHIESLSSILLWRIILSGGDFSELDCVEGHMWSC